jgi:hypothetical protein
MIEGMRDPSPFLPRVLLSQRRSTPPLIFLLWLVPFFLTFGAPSTPTSSIPRRSTTVLASQTLTKGVAVTTGTNPPPGSIATVALY